MRRKRPSDGLLFRDADLARDEDDVYRDDATQKPNVNGRCDECPKPGFHHGKECWALQPPEAVEEGEARMLGALERAQTAAPGLTVADARDRGHEGAERAASRASKIDPGWKASALEAVREHCQSFEFFLAEDVPIDMPEGTDRRAVGAVMQAASRAGLCVADGYAPAATSNASPKTRWRSLIYGRAVR